LVHEREKGGKFRSIFECACRNDLRALNKKNFEALILSGAFDTLHQNRAQLMESLDDVVTYGQRVQHEKAMSQASLFGGNSNGSIMQEPKLRETAPWTNLQRLKQERELIGFYLSAHPLDKFKDDIKLFTSHSLNKETLQTLEDGMDITVAGIVTLVRKNKTQKGKDYAFVTIEDESDSLELGFFNRAFDSFQHLLVEDNLLLANLKVAIRDGQQRFYVNSVERLESMRENNLHKLRLKLKIKTDEVSLMELEYISQMMKENKGKVPVSLDIFTPSIPRAIRMNVRKFVIDPNDELLQELRKLIGDDHVQLEKIAS
jgi:DNA polymerase-3 subunit alpha